MNSEYNHKYLLKDSSQVCPKYLYRFKLNPSGTKHNNEEKNGIIKVSTGNHGVNSIANPDDFEFFDPVAYKPLSNKEKIAIANGNKPIVTIQNAYDQALQEMQVKDPLLNGKKEWMEKQFDIIDEKVRVVNLNYAEVCEHMTDAADKARKELQLLTKQKLEIILSVDIELRRQKEQIGWLDSFIDRQRKQSLLVINSIKSTSKEKTESKLSFLNSWKNHMIFRNSISRFTPSDSSILSSISGDLHADSNINITKIPNQDSSKNVMNSSDINKITGGFAFENMDIDGSYGHNINDIKAAEKRFKSFFSKGYYGVPFKPLEDLVSDSLKGVFNEHLDRIDIALTEAMKDGEIPLPTSIIRPNIGGDNYKLPLPEILTNKQSQNNSNAQKVVNSNEVKLVFQDTLRKALGLETVLTKLDNSDTGTIAPSLDSNSIQSKQLTLASTKQSTVDMSERRKTKAAMIIDTASIQSQSQNNETSVTDDLLINNDIQSNSPLRAFSLTPNGNAFPKGFNKDEKITMSMEDLMTISEKFPQFSLIESSERKLTQLESRHVSGHIDGIASLEESNILADINEIRSVYFTLPFFTKPPNCTLLYSTFKHRRFLDELYLQCLHNRGPSIIIIQSGLYKFGVYLSHPIHINGSWTGGPSCFIFSITLDIKLSYHARNPPDATTANDTPIAFLVDRERLTIGNNDLIINQDIESGSSNIEGCFGFGNFTYNSKQSKCFLAGTNKFTIDQLEVWSINSPK